METIKKNKTIQGLPEEIIEKLLSYLSVESLKAAALTCKKLASLTFLGGRFPNDLPLYERLEINKNIKTLSFPNFVLLGVKEDALKEFLKHVPNVEKLRTTGMINLHVVSNALTRLTHLELYGTSSTLHQIKSQSLQSITIDELKFIPDWEKFASDNPRMNTMKIEKVPENFDIVKLLTNMKLQRLELPMIKVDDNVCKTLRENTQDMISLSIHKASFVNCQENLSEVKCLRFHEKDEKCCFERFCPGLI
ncbi:CLUMA_CG006105, isoform A [Clunio marinus]|uniref:CLUMA_CG006105, isoform A n=1 Tax=Clunio marinus TaxID=568069 RepID=A0A1J1I2E2_9DIPT|nr:CLUMA_CG006105, isoform A [Clunio marinus]